MDLITIAANELQINSNELIRESVRAYLMQKLSKVESEIFLLAKKYGVKNVFELDSRVKDGFVSKTTLMTTTSLSTALKRTGKS